MTQNPEKSLFISRSFACLFAASILFLILSLSILFQFGDNSLVPRSIYKLIIIKNTPDEIPFKPNSTPFVSLSSKESNSKTNQVKPCGQTQALLKVFMYNLPPEFHFGLLGFKGEKNQIWPNVSNPNQIPSYPGGLNLQHSIEYWLTLDLLSSLSPNISRPCSTILVHNSTQADVIFVPFFSSLSYNRHSKIHRNEKTTMDKILQERLVKFLKGRDEWKRLGGKNHLIIAHHPNSMLLARKHLGSAMFVLADFGRYNSQIANIDKDIIAPYKHVVKRLDARDSPSFEERPLLVYFQGAIYRKDGGVIRQKLSKLETKDFKSQTWTIKMGRREYYLLKGEKEVHFTFGSVSSGGVRKASRGMSSSKFCLNIAGDTPSSNRLFDAIASHCVPVIISDDIELPFEDVLDYSKFAVFIRASDAVKKGYLLKVLRRVRREKWRQMWERLKEIGKHFEYGYPSQSGDAVDMIWQAVYRKVSYVHDKIRRKNRYEMSQKFLDDI